MRSAQQSAEKYVTRAGAAANDYLEGARTTTKDQSTAAIAALPIAQAALVAAFARGAQRAGLQRSGKSGWLTGIERKGADRYATGVEAGKDKYVASSSRFDTARNAAASMPRGLKGSETNYARSKAVGLAERAVALGGAK